MTIWVSFKTCDWLGFLSGFISKAVQPVAEHHVAANRAPVCKWPGQVGWVEPAVWDVRFQTGVFFFKQQLFGLKTNSGMFIYVYRVKNSKTLSVHELTVQPCKGCLGLQAHQWQVSQGEIHCWSVHVGEASASEGAIIGAGPCIDRPATSKDGNQCVSHLNSMNFIIFYTTHVSCNHACSFQPMFISC